MGYSRRFSLAMLAAAAIVTGMFAGAPSLLRRIDAITMLPPPERSIRLNLKDLEPAPPPPEPDPIKRLVDAGAVADAPSPDTDLISSQASRAQDLSEQEGDPNRAAVEEIDEFDQLGANAIPAAPPAPEPTPSAAQEPPPSAEPPAEPEPAAEPAAPEKESGAPPPKADEPALPEPATKPAPREEKREEAVAASPTEAAAEAEPFKVAQATPPPRVPVQELRAQRGRSGGGAVETGVTSFEANKHALGEYMLSVRNRVERSWRTALHLRYTGASRTDAVIHCVIRPDGTIESVSIADPGSSLTYAVLCREAVEDAGPFAPFPFDVPEIYRTENLEINWKFSYL